ncbi:hypothetical protein Tsubulata_030782 [Turnera subulata]|uniref:Chaperone DnaJ C-terminal domain-containing protein n=1 Tax=Turnera subulata TaxID=218843 RepID=A0A9Q0FLK2_9ROSI|nr:hypothetical protein Tsubulata_030782 [Turnera subulata]
MGDHSYSILGITMLKDVCKGYKSLVTKWNPDKHTPKKAEDEAKDKVQEFNEPNKAVENDDDASTLTISSPELISHGIIDSNDESLYYGPPSLLKSLSKRSLSKSTSRGSSPQTPSSSRAKTATAAAGGGGGSALKVEIPSLSRTMSRTPTTPIIFSQSTKKKPPPMEKRLECTIIEQQGELVNIDVKQGWIKGTKISFEGKGDERPGYQPADLVFVIDEKPHPLFTREGDDLELAVEIPLVQALTGCTISVPLLEGDQKMSLSFDNVIYPGFVKVIRGQGMPCAKEVGKRGDLRITFLVEFPSELSDEQRSEASNILQDCS